MFRNVKRERSLCIHTKDKKDLRMKYNIRRFVKDKLSTVVEALLHDTLPLSFHSAPRRIELYFYNIVDH